MRNRSLKITNPIKVIVGNGEYNIFNVLSEFNKHRYILQAKMKGETIEGYSDVGDSGAFFTSFLGILIIIIALVLWVWALVVTVKYFSVLPIWAQILSILGLVGFGGPVLTLIVVYIGKSMGPSKSSGMGHGHKQKSLSYTNSVMGKRSMFLG
jgi:hypothetical protein